MAKKTLFRQTALKKIRKFPNQIKYGRDELTGSRHRHFTDLFLESIPIVASSTWLKIAHDGIAGIVISGDTMSGFRLEVVFSIAIQMQQW